MATLTSTEAEPGAATRPRRRRREKYNRRETLAGLLFISPWIIGFTVFTVISMAWSLRLSFSDYDLATNSGEPVGFDNYRLLFDDPKVLTSLGNTSSTRCWRCRRRWSWPWRSPRCWPQSIAEPVSSGPSSTCPR